MDGEGIARDTVLVSSGRCEWRIGGWPVRVTKTAANGLMSAGLRECPAEGLSAITGCSFPSVLRQDL